MNRLNQLPLLRLLIPFIIGILFEVYVHGNLFVTTTFFSILFLSFILLSFIKKLNSNYSLRWLFGLHIYSLFFVLGIIVTLLKKDSPQPLNNIKNQLIIGEITDPPVKKDKIVKCILEVKGVKSNEKWITIDGKTILFLEKDSLSEILNVGDFISFQPDFKDIPEPKNPNEFDYKKYLSFHLIHQQAFLKANNWALLSQTNETDIFVFADKLRRKMISILNQSGLTDNELGVASALILGYKNNIEAQLKSSYSSAGAMHILAVSGLHVGIIFMLFNAVFHFFEKIKYGLVIKGILLLLILWLYALITGLSPSVLRSASMFSIVAIGEVFNRKTNFFNKLSASALLLLLFNPLLIFDVGFQLSYIAVAGIVLMQNWLNSFYEPETWLSKYIWDLITVSLAAQLATFPLGLYYFHQFPNYFLLSNLLVIPLAFFILVIGLTTLAAGFILPKLSIVFGFCLKWLVFTLNNVVTIIDELPFSVTENIKFPITYTVLVYLIITSIILLIAYRKFYYFLAFSLMSLFLISLIGIDKYKLINQKKLIIYNIPKHTAINFIDGDDNILIADENLFKTNNKLQFHLQNNWIDKGVEMEKIINLEQLKRKFLISNIYKIDNKHLFTKSNFFQYYNYRIAIIDESIKVFNPTKKINVDYLIWTKNCKIPLNKINEMFLFKTLIIDSSNSSYINDKLTQSANKKNITYWSIPDKGAFVLDL